MATRAKELSDLGNLKLDVTANGIDVVGVGSNFKSESYNILNLQTDTNDNGSSDDGIFKITNGSAGTTKAEFRWDESEDLVHVSYGDHGRHISIGSDGKVGIATGSTAPSQTLDVNGTAIAEQYLLDAIDKDISDTAVDVFIYDTSKDSDGGAWRKRTQHTSWYNETLNTATRGARKEFPSVAVIVVESNQVTIYDGDDPDMPIWMVFNSGSYYFIGPTNRSKTCAEMLNGILCIGTTGTSAWMSYISFVDDTARQYSSVDSEKRDYLVPILNRNSASNSTAVVNSISDYSIINDNINDLTMIVLPNAIIDSATGLPKPTIAVATNGGVSIIRDSGVPTNKSGSAYITIDTVGTDYYVTKSSGDDYSVLKWSDTETSINYTKGTFKFNGNQATNYYPFLYGNGGNVLGATNKLYHSTGVQGVTLWDIEGVTDRNALQCNIGDTHNTGWMPGDIKLATLSDTRTTSLSGTNRCAADDFSSGWSISSGSNLSISNNQLAVVDTSNVGSSFCDQTITTIVGQEYVIDVTATGTSGTGIGLYVTGYGGPVLGYQWEPTYSFTATTTSTTVRLYRFEGHTGSGTITSVIIKEAAADRSVNGNGVSAFGTITKTPVATGADLVAYSGFNTTAGYSPNGTRLQQPYNSDLDFTGDFSISYWVKGSGQDTTVHWSDASGNNGWMIYHNSNTSYFIDGTWDSYVAYQQVNSTTSLTGVWTKVEYIRRGDYLYYYLNGVLKGTYNGIGSWTLTSTTAHQLAVYAGNTTNAFALLRISATAPSPEQIKKMYEDEKFLFEENAKATLYGSSGSAVTALAYDDEKELLHTGTSAGRSVFQGLTRIDNTTDAVGAAISASNGMIAED